MLYNRLYKYTKKSTDMLPKIAKILIFLCTSNESLIALMVVTFTWMLIYRANTNRLLNNYNTRLHLTVYSALMLYPLTHLNNCALNSIRPTCC